MMRALVVVVLALGLAACATTPPKNPNDLCAIFQEKKGWYSDAKKAQDKWGTSIPVMMATMHQESRFVADARPPRRYYLGFIPGSRPSNAYGYPQALDETWAVYRKQSGNGWGDRDDFGDAIDFIGWYYQQSYQVDGIKRDDAFNLYLSYYRGHKGFLLGSPPKGAAVVSQKVALRSQQYGVQLKSCVDALEKAASSWF